MSHDAQTTYSELASLVESLPLPRDCPPRRAGGPPMSGDADALAVVLRKAAREAMGMPEGIHFPTRIFEMQADAVLASEPFRAALAEARANELDKAASFGTMPGEAWPETLRRRAAAIREAAGS